MPVLLETSLPNLFRKGKVRDTYDLGNALLMIATDRISAFDVVLPNGIPDKGAVLTRLSAFWFEKTGHIVPNHYRMVVDHPEQLMTYEGLLWGGTDFDDLMDRSMIVTKARPYPVECVARGYLVGSGWAEYRKSGTVCGIRLPEGLRASERLPAPIFTPSTKAETGHDQNITFEQMADIVGQQVAETLREKTLALYAWAAAFALERGIIIADTKFEFGETGNGIILIDEVLTPDSSRFWEASEYEPGRSQLSFDKQYVRDWLDQQGWNHEPPAPLLPDEVVQRTTEKYRAAYERLTGQPLP